MKKSEYEALSVGEQQRKVSDFVGREVYYCASMLIGDLCNKEDYVEDLTPIMSQDDWEEAALQEGWEQYEDEFGVNCYRDTNDGATNALPDWQSLCEEENIEPYTVEALEHWIISDYLADKLEEQGQMIIRDFLGLTIWGRRTSGQAIAMDCVIEDIYKAMQS